MLAHRAVLGSGRRLASIDRQPWHSTLYQVARDNVATLQQASEDGFGTPLPKFVRAEFDGYLRCQVLGRGFAHMVCKDCGKPHLLAFCCRGRGFCPCCTGRKMAQTAANLSEFVLPDAPLRQWVLTVPHALRPRVAYDRGLLPRIYSIFYDSIQRFYERRLADLGHAGGRTGSVTAIQRGSSDLRLNPHLHGVFLDGVFTEAAGDALGFVDLPQLSDLDVCEVLSTVVARVLEHLRRQGLLSNDGSTLQAPEPEADDEQLVLSRWRWRPPSERTSQDRSAGRVGSRTSTSPPHSRACRHGCARPRPALRCMPAPTCRPATSTAASG